MIGEGAFLECSLLRNITIGDYVTIGKGAFYLDNTYNYSVGKYEMNGVEYEVYVYNSPIQQLVIGNYAILEEGAFYGAAKLETITLGTGAYIGDYAFYNNSSLKSIDLSSATYIGKAAFAGDLNYIYTRIYQNSAYNTPYVNSDGYYEYYYYASRLENIDLSSVTFIGEDAFSCVVTLESVVLGDKLTIIPDRAFQNCKALKSINLDKITSIGEEAFVYASLENVLDLSAVTLVGKNAFAYCAKLPGVIFGEGACTIAEGAFSYCDVLASATNLNKVTVIDKHAFAYTQLTQLDLSSATSIGSLAFIKETMTPVTVVLSEKLAYMGDNPFAMCQVAPFSIEVVVDTFNGVEYKETSYTYHLSDSIYVIDGSLYRVVPNGLELITFAGTDTRVTVAENTVRISAMAFAGSGVKEVVFPYTLASIGHKAFFDCQNLKLVTFTSFEAPVLEEEYDIMRYYSFQYIPGGGEYQTGVEEDGTTYIYTSGLGLVPYYMWNVTSQPASIFYGANFVDYVGEVEQKITMIRPSNGKYYDSFIFSQYFDTVLNGASAADDVTLNAIDLIQKLPEKVSLSDKALVEAARAAYNQISTLEQQSLVSALYTKLTAAEKRIRDLEYLQKEETPDEEPGVVPPTPSVDEKTPLTKEQVWILVLAIVGGVMTIAAATFAILFFLPNIKSASAKAKAKRQAKKEAKAAAKAETEAEAEQVDETEAATETEDTAEQITDGNAEGEAAVEAEDENNAPVEEETIAEEETETADGSEGA